MQHAQATSPGQSAYASAPPATMAAHVASLITPDNSLSRIFNIDKLIKAPKSGTRPVKKLDWSSKFFMSVNAVSDVGMVPVNCKIWNKEVIEVNEQDVSGVS